MSVEFEQDGQARAAYGKRLLAELATVLTKEFDKGFDASNLPTFLMNLSKTSFHQLGRVQMTAMIAPTIHYPSGDGQPVAETFDHLYVILITIEVLRLYLKEEQACILGNQFLYCEEGSPMKRCAPDVMVIFGVQPGSRDNYKIWEEDEIPRVVFEMTSSGTRKEDEGFKKTLYAEIGISEYWQFDPKGQWIKEKLRGFRWVDGEYVPIVNAQSQGLGLRLEVNGSLISFYRLDNGEKLLIPLELYEKAEQLQATTQDLQQQLDRYRERFGEL